MNRPLRTPAALLVALALTGCATKAQLRRGLADQANALAGERSERMAADQQLGSRVDSLGASLRTDLDNLRNEFGTRISQVESGLQFAVPVHFAFNASDVGPEATPVLDRFAQVVQRYYPGSMISVEGFADPAGSAAYNRTLSLRRADAVRDYLTSHGLPAEQHRTVGYGATRLVTPSASASAPGADLNRRVAFVVETPPTTAMGSPMMQPSPTMPDTSSTAPMPADTTSMR
jgi:peptidoglycan-associated lipoprotein